MPDVPTSTEWCYHIIIAEVRDGATHVHVQGKPDIAGIGQNLPGALGDMTEKHAPELGFRIVERT